MADSSTVFSTSAVSGAYRSSQSIQPAPGLAEDPAQAPGQTFADMIRDAAGDAVQTMRESDGYGGRSQHAAGCRGDDCPGVHGQDRGLDAR